MQVILMGDVPRVGRKGETKKVSEGYARNFLFPRKLAVPLTEGTLKNLKLVQVSWAKQAAKEKEAQLELAKKIDGVTLQIKRKAGDKGRLFGSVTSAEISELLHKHSKVEVDKREIITDHIKELGEHEVHIRFSHDAKATLKVVVLPEEEEKK